MKTVAIIPARLESSRLPNKLMKDICGMPLILHVVKRTQLAKSLDDVLVATDSEEIKSLVESHGVKVVMTSSTHQTGTDRIAEAAKEIECDIVVNVQGDEALLDPAHIDVIVNRLKQSEEYKMGFLVTPFKKANSPSDIKIVTNKFGEALYFSREDIPSTSRVDHTDFLKVYHIVPFRKEFLLEYPTLERPVLETTEFNEYLRVLYHGQKIITEKVISDCISVDTEDDLAYVREKMPEDPIFKEYSH